MEDNWLQSYLTEALEKKYCIRAHCTTCGASEFKRGLLDALARASGEQQKLEFDGESILAIGRALAQVSPDLNERMSFEYIIRQLITMLWSDIPLFDNQLEDLLIGSYAGYILEAMKKHYAEEIKSRRQKEEYERPINAQKRHEEKKRLKQEQHQIRLSLKKERDRIWHEGHKKID
jgi:hypothetical protein